MAQSERGTWECTDVDVVYFDSNPEGHIGELLIWDEETMEKGDARAAVSLTREQAQQLVEELRELLEDTE